MGEGEKAGPYVTSQTAIRSPSSDVGYYRSGKEQGGESGGYIGGKQLRRGRVISPPSPTPTRAHPFDFNEIQQTHNKSSESHLRRGRPGNNRRYADTNLLDAEGSTSHPDLSVQIFLAAYSTLLSQATFRRMKNKLHPTHVGHPRTSVSFERAVSRLSLYGAWSSRVVATAFTLSGGIFRVNKSVFMLRVRSMVILGRIACGGYASALLASKAKALTDRTGKVQAILRFTHSRRFDSTDEISRPESIYPWFGSRMTTEWNFWIDVPLARDGRIRNQLALAVPGTLKSNPSSRYVNALFENCVSRYIVRR